MTISNLINEIEQLTICVGVGDEVDANAINHSLPYEINLLDDIPFKSKQYKRPKDCLVFINGNETVKCKTCLAITTLDRKAKAKKHKLYNTSVQLNAPLRPTHPNHVSLALQEERKENRDLQRRMKSEITTKSVMVDSDLSDDINQIMENTEYMSNFTKLFWEQDIEQLQECHTAITWIKSKS